MADFINTIDALGDDAVMDSIIDRSITEFKDNKLTKVGLNAFMKCANLEEVDLPNATYLDHSAFKQCTALKSANFPNVTSISHATFDGCSSLESISMPNLETGQQNCFAGTAIKEINFPKATFLSTSFFSGCKSLERAYLPSLKSTGTLIFNNCYSLKEVYVPLYTNVGFAFLGSDNQNYNKIEILDLPSAINIAANAFNGCLLCKSFILRSGTLCTLANTNAFYYNKAGGGGSYIINDYFYIYVPRALVDSYKAATNWSEFADQFRALEDYTVDGTVTGELDETKI